MSNHPPCAFCSGRVDGNDDEEKPRVLVTNPETQRGSVHSTDQTAHDRPEWLFPRCPANMHYMLGCSLIITQHDEQNNVPHDLQVLRSNVYGDEEELEFVVRLHTGNSDLKRSLERAYFHRACPHGILVVVPCQPMIAHALESHSSDDMNNMTRFGLDQALVRILAEEEESVERAVRE